MDETLDLISRSDRVLQEMEDAEVERMNSALDASYTQLEKELLRKYPQYTSDAKPGLLATQRSVLLTAELQSLLTLINPEREQEIERRYGRLLQTASQEGVTLADELIKLRQGDRFVRATATIPIEAVSFAARDAVKRLKNHDQKFREEATAIIAQGLIQGQGSQRVATSLRQRLGVTKGRAEAIARTEIISAQDSATRSHYRQNNVEYYTRIGTQDTRICGYCADRAGKVYSVDVPVSIHPRDRCYAAPYLPEYEEQNPEQQEWAQQHAAAVRKQVEARGDRLESGAAPFERLNNLPFAIPVWTPQQGYIDKEVERKGQNWAIGLLALALVLRSNQPAPEPPEEERENHFLKALLIGSAIAGVTVGAYYLARTRYRAGFKKSAEMANEWAKDFERMAEDFGPEEGDNQVTFVAGGFAGMQGQAGLEYAEYFGEILEDHFTVGVPTPEFDKAVAVGEDPLGHVATNYSTVVGTALIDGRNMSSVRMAAMAAAYYRKHGKPVNLIGYSGGGMVASEAHEILKVMGIPVKTATLGTPWFGFTDLSPEEHIGFMGAGDVFSGLPIQNGYLLDDVESHWLDKYLGSNLFVEGISNFFGVQERQRPRPEPRDVSDRPADRQPEREPEPETPAPEQEDFIDVTAARVDDFKPVEIAGRRYLQIQGRNLRAIAGRTYSLITGKTFKELTGRDIKQVAGKEFPVLTGQDLKALPAGKVLIQIPERSTRERGGELEAIGSSELLYIPSITGEFVDEAIADFVPQLMLLSEAEIQLLPEAIAQKLLTARRAYGLLPGRAEPKALKGIAQPNALPGYDDLLALPEFRGVRGLLGGEIPRLALPPAVERQLQEVELTTTAQEIEARSARSLYQHVRSVERGQSRLAEFRIREAIAKIKQSDLPPGQKLTAYRQTILDEIGAIATPKAPIKPPGAENEEDLISFDFAGIKWYTPELKATSPALDLIRKFADLGVPDELIRHTDTIFITRQKNAHEEFWRKRLKLPTPRVPASVRFQDASITFYGGKGKVEDLLRQMGYQLAYRRFGRLDPPEGSDYRRAMEEGRPITAYGFNSPAADFADTVKEFFVDPDRVRRFTPQRYEAIARMLQFRHPTEPTVQPRRPDTRSPQILSDARTRNADLSGQIRDYRVQAEETAEKQRSTQKVRSAVERIDAAKVQADAEDASSRIRVQEGSLTRLSQRVNELEQRSAQLLNPLNKPYLSEAPQQIKSAQKQLKGIERELIALESVGNIAARVRSSATQLQTILGDLTTRRESLKVGSQGKQIGVAIAQFKTELDQAEQELVSLPRSPERSEAIRDLQRIKAAINAQSGVPSVADLHRQRFTPQIQQLTDLADNLEDLQQRVVNGRSQLNTLRDRLAQLPTKLADLTEDQQTRYAAIKRTRTAQSKLPQRVENYRQLRQQFSDRLTEETTAARSAAENYSASRASAINNVQAIAEQRLERIGANLQILASLHPGSVAWLVDSRNWEMGEIPNDLGIVLQRQPQGTRQDRLRAAAEEVTRLVSGARGAARTLDERLDLPNQVSRETVEQIDRRIQSLQQIRDSLADDGRLSDRQLQALLKDPSRINAIDVMRYGNQLVDDLEAFNQEFVDLLLTDENVDPTIIREQSELYRRAKEAFTGEIGQTRAAIAREIEDALAIAQSLKDRAQRDSEAPLIYEVGGKARTVEDIRTELEEVNRQIGQFLRIPQVESQAQDAPDEAIAQRRQERQQEISAAAQRQQKVNSLREELAGVNQEIQRRREAAERGQKRGIATTRLEAQQRRIMRDIEKLAREVDENNRET